MTQDEIQRIAHLNEIIVSDWPAAEDYIYKIRIEVSSLFSRDVLVKELSSRSVPAWMLNVRQDPQSKVDLTLLFRANGTQDPWQEAGSATLQLTEALAANPGAANVTLPVTTWSVAPKLKFRVRLLSSLLLERTRGLRQIPHVCTTRPETFVDSQRELLAAKAEETIRIPNRVPLTEPEEVIVKDTWNKLLAWKELAVPMFYRRLAHKAPELGERLESVGPEMAEQFFGLLDLCVRSLQPQTEHVLREAYRGVHPSPEFPCDTVEKYARLFADMGVMAHHWRQFRDVLLWVLPSVPYIEEYELGNMELGHDSAWYRFLNGHVVAPMLKELQQHNSALDNEGLDKLSSIWSSSDARRRAGLDAYRHLFESNPESVEMFGRVNIDRAAEDFSNGLESVVSGLNDWRGLMGDLHDASQPAFFTSPISKAGPALSSALRQNVSGFSDELESAWQAVAGRSKTMWEQASRRDQRMFRKASEYVEKVGKELGWDPRDLEGRLYEIGEEIAACGTYTHTYEEMCYGAQMAWRNASKCVGRLAWKQLMIRDLRHVNHPDDMFEELKEHLRIANNGGKVNPTVSLFRPMRPGEAWGPRIWNPQLIRYAAYRLSDGKIMGDPANLALTEAILKLGWTPPHPRTPWDILPLVIEIPGMQPSLYELPRDLVLEVDIRHPKYEQFSHMGLRWYVIPAISNFRLEVGGISYGCCPFNGWYLVTEVARDFTDDYRYDKLEEIAQNLGLDTSSIQTMWRDEAFLETNKAILWSFQKSKMTIVDHHSASRQFLTHDLREKKAGRECPGQWSWVVPPLGGTTCPVYHHEMRDFFLEPQYYYHADKWAVESEAGFAESSWLAAEMTEESVQVKIFHASDDDSAEHMARLLGQRFDHYQPLVREMSTVEREDLTTDPTVLLLVVGTVDGVLLPKGAEALLQQLSQRMDNELERLAFGLLVVGNRAYGEIHRVVEPLAKELLRVGGRLMLPTAEADDLLGQTAAFTQWSSLVARMMGDDATAATTEKEAAEMRLSVKETAVGAVPRPKPLRGHWARINGHDVIHNADGRETHRLVIDSSQMEAKHQVGDRLAIYPRHDAGLVERLSRRLGLGPETAVFANYVGVFGEELDEEPPFPSPMALHDLLAGELRLSWTEPFPAFLRSMLASCGDPKEAARLQDLAGALERGDLEHKRTMGRQLAKLYPTVVELLEAFPSVQMKVKTLIELLPKVRPVYLTICSSAELEPSKIQVVVDLPASEGDATARYLKSLNAGDPIRIDILESPFRLMSDDTAPLLLVGQGAGLGVIAGCVSEMATRAQLGQTTPTLHVVASGGLGSYESQMRAWASRGVIAGLSQSPSETSLWSGDSAAAHADLLKHPQCRVYLSGDSLFEETCYDGLVELLQSVGGCTYLEAIDLLRGMETSGRLHRNLVPTTPGRNTLEDVRKAKYSQGARWLRRYGSLDRLENAAAGG